MFAFITPSFLLLVDVHVEINLDYIYVCVDVNVVYFLYGVNIVMQLALMEWVNICKSLC